MYQYFRRLAICAIFPAAIYCFFALAEKDILCFGVIRGCVAENSNTQTDPQWKQITGETLLDSVYEDLISVSDITAAKDWLAENVEKVHDAVKKELGDNSPIHSALTGDNIPETIIKELTGQNLFKRWNRIPERTGYPENIFSLP